MLLSVVIPAYSRPLELALALRRLALLRAELSGQHGMLEVLVVNDGGPRDIDQVASDWPWVSYHYLDPATTEFRAGAARNLGAARALGERILFLDSDCLATRECLLHHASYGAQNILVAGRIDFVELQHTPQNMSQASSAAPAADYPPTRLVEHDRRFALYGDVGRRLRQNPQGVFRTTRYEAFWSGNLSVPAKEFCALGGFWEELKGYGSEDQELAWRMQKCGSRLQIDFRALALHLGAQHPQLGASRRQEVIRRSAAEPSWVRPGRFLPV